MAAVPNIKPRKIRKTGRGTKPMRRRPGYTNMSIICDGKNQWKGERRRRCDVQG